jgi:hypothetical protein
MSFSMPKSFELSAHALRCCATAVVLIAPGCALAVQPQTHLPERVHNNGDDLFAASSFPAAAVGFALVGYGSPPPLVATAALIRE